MKTYNLRFSVDCSNDKLEKEVKELVEQYLAEHDNVSTDVSFKEIKFITLNSRNSSGILRKICQHDIIYIEKSGHSSLIVTHSETLRVNCSIARLLQTLDSTMFFRSHQGFIVNLNEIKSINTFGLQLFSCERIIPVSRRNRILLEQKSYFS